jgi:5'-phosphate synthase pdxT subunit
MALIGILALQGAFDRHAQVARRLGHDIALLRGEEDFDGVEGLVLPGGESTVQLKLLERLELERALREVVRRGHPVLATCAGLVLAARRVHNPEQKSFGFIDVAVARNAWGRQTESFEATSDRGLPLVFIRAPRIVDVGPGVELLDTLGGEPVLVRQGNVTCMTFHPELTSDARVHERVFGRRRAPTKSSGVLSRTRSAGESATRNGAREGSPRRATSDGTRE